MCKVTDTGKGIGDRGVAISEERTQQQGVRPSRQLLVRTHRVGDIEESEKKKKKTHEDEVATGQVDGQVTPTNQPKRVYSCSTTAVVLQVKYA